MTSARRLIHVAERLSEAQLHDLDFQKLRDLIYISCGIHLVPAKRTMVELRLRKRLHALHMQSFREYREYVTGRGGEAELTSMIDLITTNKTDFYREPGHFDFLTRVALPSLPAGVPPLARLERRLFQR